jgi:hypothetical protein
MINQQELEKIVFNHSLSSQCHFCCIFVHFVFIYLSFVVVFCFPHYDCFCDGCFVFIVFSTMKSSRCMVHLFEFNFFFLSVPLVNTRRLIRSYVGGYLVRGGLPYVS